MRVGVCLMVASHSLLQILAFVIRLLEKIQDILLKTVALLVKEGGLDVRDFVLLENPVE